MAIAINLEKARVAEMYRQMLLIRRFEEEAARQYMRGNIRGFLHLYIGQEAVSVGVISALNAQDYVVSHYRDHGHALAKGMDPKVVMAELFGKASGSSGGKGGSMHLFDVSRGFMGGYAIVGGQMPIAVGIALAIKYKREDRVTVCFFGDGAMSEGEFHESLNLASLWKLPVLFVLENNLYGMGTGVERTHARGQDIYLGADAYVIPAAQVDGMDLLAVRNATVEALIRIHAGGGPVFLEALTYRFRGHSMADPENYRQKAEVAQWAERDPIRLFQQLLGEEGLMTPDEVEEVGREVAATVREAVRFAEESPDPDLDSLSENVYA